MRSVRRWCHIPSDATGQNHPHTTPIQKTPRSQDSGHPKSSRTYSITDLGYTIKTMDEEHLRLIVGSPGSSQRRAVTRCASRHARQHITSTYGTRDDVVANQPAMPSRQEFDGTGGIMPGDVMTLPQSSLRPGRAECGSIAPGHAHPKAGARGHAGDPASQSCPQAVPILRTQPPGSS
jgi:hypothetical protein